MPSTTRSRTPYPPPAFEVGELESDDDEDFEISIQAHSTPSPRQLAFPIFATSPPPPPHADCVVSAKSIQPTEASFDACILRLTTWISKYVVYELSGLTDESEINPERTHNFPVICQTVYDLLHSHYQTPFTLIHVLVYVHKLALDGYEIDAEDLMDPESDIVDRLCLLLKVFFILAVEALQDESLDNVDDMMSLKFKMNMTGLTRLAEYEESRLNVLETIRFPEDDSILMEGDMWRDFSARLCAFALDHTLAERDDTLTPVVITSFLELSHVTSKVGDIPFVHIPVAWLAAYDEIVYEEEEKEESDSEIEVEEGMLLPIFRPKPKHAINIALLERQCLSMSMGEKHTLC